MALNELVIFIPNRVLNTHNLPVVGLITTHRR